MFTCIQGVPPKKIKGRGGMCFHKLTHLTALVLCKSCAIQMERSWRTFPVLQNIYTEVLF